MAPERVCVAGRKLQLCPLVFCKSHNCLIFKCSGCGSRAGCPRHAFACCIGHGGGERRARREDRCRRLLYRVRLPMLRRPPGRCGRRVEKCLRQRGGRPQPLLGPERHAPLVGHDGRVPCDSPCRLPNQRKLIILWGIQNKSTRSLAHHPFFKSRGPLFISISPPRRIPVPVRFKGCVLLFHRHQPKSLLLNMAIIVGEP